jgi:hypothetical protein
MRNSYKILIGVASLAIIGAIIFVTKREKSETMRRRAQEVSDEGYEFAYDVLYPLRGGRVRNF